MGLKEWLIPQDKVFFTLLEQQSKLVLEGAKMLVDIFQDYRDIDEKRRNVKDLEHQGDEVVHSIQDMLARTFITPIDREDIDRLSSLYDDVLDHIYAVVNRLYLYEIREPTPTMQMLAEVVLKSVEQLNAAFHSMRRRDKNEIDKRNIEVHFFENEADELLNNSVAQLFKQKDVVTIIKYKEIYEFLELLTDICEDVSNTLRDIVLKHS